MLKKRNLLYICFLFVSLTNCERSTAISNAPSPAASPTVLPRNSAGAAKSEVGSAGFDVCGLLKPNEIEARIESPIKESKSSERWSGSLRISQCVYVAVQPSKSVSLVLTQADPGRGGKESVRDFWDERFGRYRERSEEKKEAAEEKEEAKRNSNEEEREGRPPRKVEGLGDEAFWTAGSLYVLKKDAFLRISVGGPDSEEAKLEQSKVLAAIALKRL
jgi:hypothetical protein